MAPGKKTPKNPNNIPPCCLEDPNCDSACDPIIKPVKYGGNNIISLFKNSLQSDCMPTIKPSLLLNRWRHKEAVDYFDVLFKKYGAPYMAKNKAGGFCIWKYNTIPQDDIHVKIELKDEAVHHSVPKPHIDFLYSYIRVYIPPEKLNEVLTISGSVVYDPLKKELFARCGSLEANYATLRTVFDKLNSRDSNYPDNINTKDEAAEYNLNIVKKDLLDNNTKYEKELLLDCYPGAFPKLCTVENMEKNKKSKASISKFKSNFNKSCGHLDDCSCQNTDTDYNDTITEKYPKKINLSDVIFFEI